jgi:hypothetical protein
MIPNGITHTEVVGAWGYTAEGAVAGASSNVAHHSNPGIKARYFIDVWMTGPFHAIGILRHNLRASAYGSCSTTNSAASLDVIRGLVSAPRPADPIVFPGQEQTVPVYRFITESPNPITMCGWTNVFVGVPIVVMMPNPVTSATATLNGPTGPIEVCVLYNGHTGGDALASSLLAGDNAIIVVPRVPLGLADGRYSVNVNAPGNPSPSWNFNVVRDGPLSYKPLPPNTPPLTPPPPSLLINVLGPTFWFQTGQLAPGTTVSYQFPGVNGVPANAQSVILNVVVSSIQSNGFLTVFPHGGARPTASNQNYFMPAPTQVCPARPTRSNPCKLVQGPSVDSFSTIVFAKIGDGGFVDFYVHGSVTLFCEVLGYMSLGGAGGSYLTPVSPFRLYDSREASYAPRGGVPLSQNEQRTLTVPSIPANSPAVFLDVVATGVTGSGVLLLSAGPCGSSPSSQTVAFNPTRVAIANFNLVGLQNNQFCVTSTAPGTAHVVIDAAAYLQTTPSKVFNQMVPTRVYDTRDNSGAFRDGLGPLISHVPRSLNLGTTGVPGGATGVVVTLTVTETTGPVSVACAICLQLVSLD